MTKGASSALSSKGRTHLRRRSATSVMINKSRPPRNLTNDEAANLKAKIKQNKQSDLSVPTNDRKDNDAASQDKVTTENEMEMQCQKPAPRRNPGRAAKPARASKSVFSSSEEEESDYEDLDQPQQKKKKKKKQVKEAKPKANEIDIHEVSCEQAKEALCTFREYLRCPNEECNEQGTLVSNGTWNGRLNVKCNMCNKKFTGKRLLAMLAPFTGGNSSAVAEAVAASPTPSVSDLVKEI